MIDYRGMMAIQNNSRSQTQASMHWKISLVINKGKGGCNGCNFCTFVRPESGGILVWLLLLMLLPN